MNARTQMVTIALALCALTPGVIGQSQTVSVLIRPQQITYGPGGMIYVRRTVRPLRVYRWHRRHIFIYNPTRATRASVSLAGGPSHYTDSHIDGRSSTGNGMRMWYDPSGRRPPVYADHNPFPSTGTPEFVPNRGGMDGMEIQARERTAVGQAQAGAAMATQPHAGGYRLWYDPSGRRPPVYSDHNPF